MLLMAFDTLTQLSFKLAGNHALPVEASTGWLLRLFGHRIYGAVAGYVGAFFVWMGLLKKAPIGPAFAASHLEVVSVMLLSAWLFGEPLTLVKLVGAAAILAGIACLALAEDGDAAAPPPSAAAPPDIRG
jgi:drug/metabolite transporter (DMT)-like permease